MQSLKKKSDFLSRREYGVVLPPCGRGLGTWAGGAPLGPGSSVPSSSPWGERNSGEVGSLGGLVTRSGGFSHERDGRWDRPGIFFPCFSPPASLKGHGQPDPGQELNNAFCVGRKQQRLFYFSCQQAHNK